MFMWISGYLDARYNVRQGNLSFAISAASGYSGKALSGYNRGLMNNL